MQVALDKNGKRHYADKASKENEYFCPICKEAVILRQGEINVEHFAHKAHDCRDTWSHDMSEWHYRMQSKFPKEQREVIVEHNGVIHRADVLCDDKVIEFQHSPISAKEIRERTEFYNSAGYKVAWVFDVDEYYSSGRLWMKGTRGIDALCEWKYPNKSLIVFAPLNKYSKKVALYFWHIAQDGGMFDRVIWFINSGDTCSFSRFMTSCYRLWEKDSMTVAEFFKYRHDAIEEHIQSLGKKCIEIYENGCNYECPRTSEGVDYSCMDCESCVCVEDFWDEIDEAIDVKVHCCYPEVLDNFSYGEYFESCETWIEEGIF